MYVGALHRFKSRHAICMYDIYVSIYIYIHTYLYMHRSWKTCIGVLKKIAADMAVHYLIYMYIYIYIYTHTHTHPQELEDLRRRIEADHEADMAMQSANRSQVLVGDALLEDTSRSGPALSMPWTDSSDAARSARKNGDVNSLD
jgi:hypothetical protein